VFAKDINFISFIDLRQVSPGLKSLLEVIPLLNILTPSLWINIDAAAVEVNIASEPHASSSITSSGMFLSKRNLFSPFKAAFSPANGSNCLNKKPIKITINEAIKKTKNITFSHEPVNLGNNKTLNICGHYHPKTYIKNNGDKLSFRCFAMDMNKNVLYLPAFGDLTGGYPCKKSFKKWAIVSEEEIIEIKS